MIASWEFSFQWYRLPNPTVNPQKIWNDLPPLMSTNSRCHARIRLHLRDVRLVSPLITAILTCNMLFILVWIKHCETETKWLIFCKWLFQMHFLKRKVVFWLSSLKFVPKGPVGNNWAMVGVMAWRGRGHKPFPALIHIERHIYIYSITMCFQVLRN